MSAGRCWITKVIKPLECAETRGFTIHDCGRGKRGSKEIVPHIVFMYDIYMKKRDQLILVLFLMVAGVAAVIAVRQPGDVETNPTCHVMPLYPCATWTPHPFSTPLPVGTEIAPYP